MMTTTIRSQCNEVSKLGTPTKCLIILFRFNVQCVLCILIVMQDVSLIPFTHCAERFGSVG
jgi:hypothetical protein